MRENVLLPPLVQDALNFEEMFVTGATLCVYFRLLFDPVFLVAPSTEAHSRNTHLSRILLQSSDLR